MLLCALAAILPAVSRAQDDVVWVGGATGKAFYVAVQRDSVRRNTVYGTLRVDGKILGRSYERADSVIASGSYTGIVRQYSPKGHSQGPFGTIGVEGDFLLEIMDAKSARSGMPKTNVLFHGGNVPSQSMGCIMLGPVSRDSGGGRYLRDADPLRQLRLAFYGSDVPLSTPEKNIVIDVFDVPRS